MTNSLDYTEKTLAHWQAKDPLFGTGWSDVQSQDWVNNPPHVWTVGKKEAKLFVLLKKGTRYMLVLDILRFVSDEQRDGFSLLIDGEKASLTGPERTDRSGPGGGVFITEITPRPEEETRLTFCVEQLQSFHDTNASDPDALPRGLALASMTFIALDDVGAKPARPRRSSSS